MTRRPELIWEGKYDAEGNRRLIPLPSPPPTLTVIERYDPPLVVEWEPSTRGTDASSPCGLDGFRNLLIRGDNRLAFSALLPRFQGRVTLAYLDPPFGSRAEYPHPLPMSDPRSALLRDAAIEERIAYRDNEPDTGACLNLLYQQMSMVKELLAKDGSLYVHCDWRLSRFVPHLLDELFGPDCFQNEIIWAYRTGGASRIRYARKHDSIFFYTRSPDRWTFHPRRERSYMAHRYGFRRSDFRIDGETGRQFSEVYPRDVFEIPSVGSASRERLGFRTQKPEALLERLILASSNEGDLVLDGFCGSGTTPAVAQKLKRRWIACDRSRHAVQTTIKRVVDLQREQVGEGGSAPPFDLIDLAGEERRWWRQQHELTEDRAYRAEVLRRFRPGIIGTMRFTAGSPPLFLQPSDKSCIAIAGTEEAISGEWLRRVAHEAATRGAVRLTCLGWKMERDAADTIPWIAKETGVVVDLRLIPRELMETDQKRALFFSPGKLRVEAQTKDGGWDAHLVAFSPAVPDGIHRNEMSRKRIERLMEWIARSPFDFLDHWSVDFESEEGEPFRPDWHSFRTPGRSDIALGTDLAYRMKSEGAPRIVAKAVDLFGEEMARIAIVRGESQ